MMRSLAQTFRAQLGVLVLGVALTGCQDRDADSSSLAESEGFHVDNGGDAIVCTASPDNAFAGTYTLDYVLTYNAAVGTTEDPVGDWPTLRQRMVDLVSAKLPELAPSLNDYLSLLQNTNEAHHRVWKATQGWDLADIEDEDVANALDQLANCRTTNDAGEDVPHLQQMVRRRYKIRTEVPKVFYRYSYSKFEWLKAHRPLQFSYLVFHEWLWDFAEGAWANRSVNRLLHSTSAEEMSPTALRNAVRSYGLATDAGGYLGVESPRAQQMRDLFTSYDSCHYPRRISAPFLPDDGRLVLPVGGQVRLALDLDPAEVAAAIDNHACGAALLLSHRGLGGASSLDLKVWRNSLRWPIHGYHHLSSGSQGLSQEMFTGICAGVDCLHRQGELQYTITPQEFSLWTLELRNTGNTDVEVVLPYMTFVQMRESP